MKSLLAQILAAPICLVLLLPCHAGKIHDAVAKRDIASLDRALKQEPKQINARCYPDFKTPLYMAVAAGDPDLVRMLITSGAKVDVQEDLLRNTPLHVAVENQPPREAIDVIIAAGADVNASNKDGVTPLMLAVRAGSAAAVDALLSHQAATDAEDLKGRPVISYAADGGNDAIVKHIFQTGGRNIIRTADKGRLFRAAAMGGSMALTEILLAEGVDINVRDEEGFTPLLTAVESNHKELSEYLILKGANLKAKSNDGRDLFEVACRAGNIALAKKLLDDGHASKRRPSLLSDVVLSGHVESVEYLLTDESNVNFQGEDGSTPLTITICASQIRNQPVTKHPASEDDYARIVELLLEHGAKVDQINAPVVKLLLGKHLDVNAKNKRDGATPLHYAAAANSLECVELLLNAGASPNALDSNHANPLVAAVNLKGCLEILESDRTKAADGLREVALDQLSRLRIIYLLLQAGAATNMNIKDSPTARQVFLRYARDMGTPEIVELLENPPPVAKKKPSPDFAPVNQLTKRFACTIPTH
jgi:hypothetical protein